MKTPEQIQKRISEIESDSRYQSGLKHPASVVINAPLAMIQVSMESEIRSLRWVIQNTEGEA